MTTLRFPAPRLRTARECADALGLSYTGFANWYRRHGAGVHREIDDAPRVGRPRWLYDFEACRALRCGSYGDALRAA